MEIDDLKEKTTDLTDHIEDLAQTFYKLSAVRITQKASNVSAGAVVLLLVIISGLFVLLFAGLAFAWWMGDVVNSRSGGFLLSAGLFIIVLSITLGIKKKVIFPYIRNLVIRKIYDKQD